MTISFISGPLFVSAVAVRTAGGERVLPHKVSSYDNIDGLDYQILVEADFLVNLYEDDAGNRAIDKAYKRIFKTETGKKIFRLMFGYEEED